MIKGGYILQPRIIQESDISVAPPYVREIWSYLLREANSCDVKYNGHEIKRGQLFRTYEEIREGTKWYIGWRKMMYNENHMKKAMKFLRDTHRITTMKELGGVMITILKYDYYQDPKNYERTTKAPKERTIAEPLRNHPLPDNNNNDKNKKNDNDIEQKKKIIYSEFYDSEIAKTDDLEYIRFVKWLFGENEVKRQMTKILSMNDQIGLEQWGKIKAIAQEHGSKIYDTCRNLENYKKSNYTSFYLTLNNWLKPKKEKAVC